eukprot:s617_g32.t1
MCFREKVPWTVLGVSKPGSVWIGAKVLPMGWASAVGVLQHAHRRLALRSPLSGGAGLLAPCEAPCEIRRDAVFPDLELERSMWSLYLDDTTLVEMLDRRVAAELAGKESDEQQRLRLAYQHWGIPVSKEKSLVRAQSAEKLGAVVDGEKGLLKGSTRRALENMSLGFWLIRQDQVPRKSLQVFLGKEVHTIQFRRPLFRVFDYLSKDVAEGKPLVQLGLKSVEEIMLSGATQPLRVTDLRARLHELVTASDASESGGGMVYGHKLSMRGLKEALAIEEGWDEPPQESVEIDEPQVILVFDFFAGIGGLSRSLQLAGVEVAHLVVIESDPSCRRLNAVRWPGCEILTDIEKITKKQLEKIMRSVPGLTGVIAGGGSPCQGLSQLSANRKHLADPRSQLFYKLCAILGWIDELCNELQVWNIDFVENVVGDGEFEEELEPLGPIADEGWTWPMGHKDSTSRLPTFTRAIPRKRPPAAPAGIASCSDETLMRWRTDSMKYPPYTYKDEYLFESKETPSLKRVIRK